MPAIGKRTSMALYSDPTDHYSHRVRIVMEEKGVSSEIVDSDTNNLTDEILEISPYATLPILVDRDVCLYDSIILMEYLDERFPHPPLLPVYPVSRAHIRLFIQRIEKDWCFLFDQLNSKSVKDAQRRKMVNQLRSFLVSAAPIFKEKKYFMSDDFSLVDCCIGPILWRLPSVGIDFKEELKTRSIHEYMKRVFTRQSFIDSLSELEREMRSVGI